MLTKKNKILIFLIALLLAGTAWWWFGLRASNDPLNQALLSPSEKSIIKTIIKKTPKSEISDKDLKRVIIFLESYASLYNSYGFDDYNNVKALVDYQTEEMQKKNMEWLAKLQRETKPGFSVATKPDLSTLTYQIIDNNSLIAMLKANVEEFNNFQSIKKYSADYFIKVEFGVERRILISDTIFSVLP